MLDQVRNKLRQNNCDVFVSMNGINRRYLTNFTGSSGLVWIGEQSQILITDFRYVEQVKEQSPDWQLIMHKNSILEVLKQLVAEHNVKRIAFESEYITVDLLNKWEADLSVEFVPTKNWVLDMRMTKSNKELELIARAAELTDLALADVMLKIKPGIKEIELALELEYTMRKMGAEDVSFKPIIGSGPRGALPHARAGQRQLTKGDFVVIDMGCIYKGYCSDMTRTFLLGQPTNKQLEIYNLVLKAQQTALEAIKPGMSGKQIDKIARDIITDAGYGDYFGHGLGHGVGLEVHEEPRLSLVSEHQLAPGMVVTVEPGVYLPDWGGVRIEDLVAVTDTGYEVFSHTSKELYIID